MISNKKLISLNKDFFNYNCGYIDDILSFEINNDDDNEIDISFTNSIKRIIDEENEAYIINEEFFEINKNNTIFNLDVITHRLKMFPFIIKEVEKYNIDDILIELKYYNDSEYPQTIFSSDFIFKYKDKEIPNFIGYNKMIFLNVIRPGEGIELYFKIKKDIPLHGGAFLKQCSKNVCYFKPDEEQLNILVKESGLKTEEEILHFKIENREITYKKNKYKKPMVYIFELESNGVTSSLNSLKEGVKILIDKLQNIIKNIDNEDYFVLELNENNPKICDMKFVNETHTLGNLLSSYLSRHELIDVANYIIPHPLDNKMFVYLQYKDKNSNTIENSKKVITEKITSLIKLYDAFIKNF